MAIECINFALSNQCNAKCVWCPTTRGTKYNYDMPFDMVFKVIEEVSDPSFPWKIRQIHLSENGEALYNPEFLKIVRYIKGKLPDTQIQLLSNFALLTPDIARTLLEEKIIDGLQVNIDGHDADSYKAAKGITYDRIIKNLKDFVDIRAEVNPDFKFRINVMTAFEYAITVDAFFGKKPDQVTSSVPYSSYNDTVKSLRSFVPLDIDIVRSKPGFWAERKLAAEKQELIDETQLDCPLLGRVQAEVFLAPSGDWYPCCLDDNNDIVLGNVNESTLLEIHNSERRLTFIQNLKDHKFKENGYPCSTVLACQTISIPEEEYENMTKHYRPGTSKLFK